MITTKAPGHQEELEGREPERISPFIVVPIFLFFFVSWRLGGACFFARDVRHVRLD
jgi:hypothetical protein